MSQRAIFRERLAFGRVGEGHIANWLRRARGFHVLPVYEKEIHTGKGPVFFPSVGKPLVAPDLIAMRREIRGKDDILWIEAKTKTAFTWYRNKQKWTTGIDKRHYGDYLELSKLSPWPIWLLFLHYEGQAKDSPPGCPTGLYGDLIDSLAKKISHTSNNWGKSGMVYWTYESLRKIATLEEVLRMST